MGVPRVSRLCKRSVLTINRCAAVVVIHHISYRELSTSVEVCACTPSFYVLKVRTELFSVAIKHLVGWGGGGLIIGDMTFRFTLAEFEVSACAISIVSIHGSLWFSFVSTFFVSVQHYEICIQNILK